MPSSIFGDNYQESMKQADFLSCISTGTNFNFCTTTACMYWNLKFNFCLMDACTKLTIMIWTHTCRTVLADWFCCADHVACIREEGSSTVFSTLNQKGQPHCFRDCRREDLRQNDRTVWSSKYLPCCHGSISHLPRTCYCSLLCHVQHWLLFTALLILLQTASCFHPRCLI